MIRRSSLSTFAAGLAVALVWGAGLGQERPVPGGRHSPSSRLTPRLSEDLAANEGNGRPIAVWVYLADKGIAGASALDLAVTGLRRSLDDRCLWRRLKVLDESSVTDAADLPVSPLYKERIVPLVERVRTESRWLNAVSAEATPRQVRALARLPFVRGVDKVLSFARSEPEEPSAAPPVLDLSDPIFALYGPSFIQINQVDVWPLHRQGFSGRGVRVGMLDTGFRKSHEVFRQAHLIAEHDFVNNDGDVSQNLSDANDYSDAHGTGTWSILGGYRPGQLVGPAYGADFLLAKTESEKFELAIEEDYWVAGIEWEESLGVEVVSSSLGYTDWYTFPNMDGRTAVTTRAANRAASLGVVVVNAAGNERGNAWGHIIAPADGFDVIACGAVNSLGRIASFSSPGPTADGRIKPEVCALGVNNWLAANTSAGGSTYTTGSGTSFATPLVAGVAALLLEIHRDWTPAQVRSALLSSASRSQSPNNDYGWGIVDAALAADVGVPVVALDHVTIDDDAIGSSLGNGDGKPEPGETLEITIALKNRSRVSVSGLSGTLSTAQPDFSVSPSRVNFPPLDPDAARDAQTPFVVKISPNFQGRHVVFWLRVDGPQGIALTENVTLLVSR
jgi:serine protease AprX